MRISFFTKQFDPIVRFRKEVERRINVRKYALLGKPYRVWLCSHALGGHPDVVDSFIKGAGYFSDVELLIDPSREEACGSIAYVLHSYRILSDVIKMKRAGIVKKLIAGPLICFESPSEHGGIVTDDSIDCYLLASQWVKDSYVEQCRAMGRSIKKLQIWPAGVDENKWAPPLHVMSETNRALRALLYVKHDGALMTESVSKLLSEFQIEVRTLTYGNYAPNDYKQLLEWCDFVVELGESETQGMTLFQAWSMDRPTLVYESQSVIDRRRDAAPYLTPQTGAKWHDTGELRALLGSLPTCTPRQWVLENGTNKVSFRRFLDIVESLGD